MTILRRKGVNFILEGLRKHTKDIDFKPLGITLLSILFLGTVTFIKYKPVYTVTVSGEALGYVNSKEELNKNLNDYKNHREGTIASIEIANMPEYKLELVGRKQATQEKRILEKIEDSSVITYKTYAITVNGEKVNEVNTQIEAESIVSNLQSDLKEGVEFNLGIAEVLSTEQNGISQDSAFEVLNGMKLAKTQEYEAEQARLEQERIAKERAARLEQSRRAAIAAARVGSYGSGNIGGMNLSYPLRTSPLITSRFGEYGSRRYMHTGLDLATQMGTAIYPIASGTVIFAGWDGSYGNKVVVDHGNGVQSWYAHCNSINVGVGTEVTTDTCIAAVGSTGNSTGPHLHLEIRINGSAVNPQNYLY